MMRYINQFIFFISISLLLPTSVNASDMAFQPSGVFKFQQKLATNGNAHAQYKLGTMYECGTGIELDIEKAKHWYDLASAAGIKAANDRLTYLSIKEQGYDQAKNSAWLNTLKKEADSSNGDSMFLLAQLYREGLGVAKDLNKALKILDKVSLLGAADVDEEIAMIQEEIKAGNKAAKAAQRGDEIEAERIAQQVKQQQIDKQVNKELQKAQQASKEQQIAKQEEAEKASQAAKIRRYEKAMMQLQLEQQQIDKQQAWASGGAAAAVDDEF